MNFTLKPNFKVAGPVFGGKIKDFAAALSGTDAAEAASKLEAGEEILLIVGGEETRINRDLVEVKIMAKEGFTVAMENNLFTILDTTISRDLLQEGLARELVSKVQQLRKQHDFEMMDHIRIQIQADPEVQEAVEKHIQYIRSETLAEEVNYSGEEMEKVDLNGHPTGIQVEKI
jgi:isoleucyl-tRNA synthetase